MIKYVTGIGSRSTPLEIQATMREIASYFRQLNIILRSGGAEGADKAFEQGVDDELGQKEIYLPWKGFNKSQSPLYGVCEKALAMASTIHPNWDACSQGAKLLHGRNCYQVLGKNLDTPSDLLICWTENGEVKGGTATAIKLAIKSRIPVFNLAIEGDYKKVLTVLS